ncbi:MAG: DUF4229 domain-containing protein [Thermobifida fusca]|jgi:cytoskeletal protein RodZ|nr:DUF4229 domain-containing protein [Thermobifida fusca]HLU43425.1 DUF4229 domain-containing protein [Natronosporangium sp.]
MSAVKYTLGRIGLFLAVMLVLYPVPKLSLLVKMLVAVVASAALSWVLLRRWRDEFAEELAVRSERRKVEKERLRAALAGEEEAESEPAATESEAAAPSTDEPDPAGRPR